VLMMAKAGRLNGCLIEGMGCPGGCVAGVGTIVAPEKGKASVDKLVSSADAKVPPLELEELAEDLSRME
ncbi:MAG: iron hydrogenase, partial [Clostridia bacterium]|nr:iron hydrogenase [Clostridia bacterium]